MSIHDVARAAGVSVATVSRALRGLPNVSAATRATVLAAAERIGYVASPSASALASGRHSAVAFVVPSLGTWFSTEVFEGADFVLRRHGYDMFLVDLAAGPGNRDRLFHNRLLRRRADAVIALDVHFSPAERRELRALAIPSIVVGGRVPGLRGIGLDDADATDQVMAHLLALGHRRIFHVTGAREFGVTWEEIRARQEGWRRGLAAAGVEPGESWIGSGGFTMPQAKVVARAMLTGAEPPTAIFAASDEMAFGVLQAAVELGIDVPGELSVAGIDGHMWSGAYGLTTIRQTPHDFGAEAARVLLEELDGHPRRQRSIRRTGTLVVRYTTAAPRRTAAVVARGADAKAAAER